MSKNKSNSKKTGEPKATFRLSLWCFVLLSALLAAVGGYFLNRGSVGAISNPAQIIDAQWNYPNSGSSNYTMTDISVDMQPRTEPAPDGYFYAAEFYYSNNNTGYMGLQDEGNAHDGITYPKTALIEIFGATSVNPASGIKSSCTNYSGEGFSCALHDVFNWVPGHTYRFYYSLTTANNGKGSEIWSAKFADMTTGTSTQLGTFNIPTSWQYLGHAILTFQERFSGGTSTCSQIHPSFAVFSNALANNGSLVGTTDSSFRSDVDPTECSGFVDNHVDNNVAYSGYGPNITCYDPTISGSTGCDSVPPVVNVSSPANGLTIKNQSVTIQASSTDNVGVDWMEVYIDGTRVTTSTTSSISYDWNAKAASRGQHTIMVTAHDMAGNIGKSTVTVTK